MAMLYISYNFYEGGSDFSFYHLPVILISLLAPFGIAAAIALLVRLFNSEIASKVFYVLFASLSFVGGALNVFAAYLAWWSTTK